MNIPFKMENARLINEKFFDKIAKHYDKGIFASVVRKMHLKITQLRFIKDNSKILDAGCGTGDLLSILANNKSLKLYGIDISKEMIKISRRKLKNKAKIQLSSAEELKFAKNYFDYVFSIDAFHHYESQDKAMKNFQRILKKRGSLIIVDVNFRIFNWFFHLIEPGNTKMYSSKEMVSIFKKYKFKKIEQSGTGFLSTATIGERGK